MFDGKRVVAPLQEIQEIKNAIAAYDRAWIIEFSGWIKLSDDFLSKMPFDECSAAMGFEIKEIKRQSRAVKVTQPPADRR